MRTRFRLRIALLVFILAPLIGAVPTLASEPQPPNIVFILADDLGYGDVGAFNEESKVRTPHLDGLAQGGRRFTDAHAPGSVCVPSRYGLITGEYSFRAPVNWNKGAMVEAGQPTIATLLGEAGYHTAMVGKWHLGFVGGNDFDLTAPLRGGPVDRGFDRFFGMHASLDIPPYFYIRGDRAAPRPFEKRAGRGPEDPHWTNIQGPFWRGGPTAPGFEHIAVLPRFREEAVRYLQRRARADDDRPSFLYLALTAPHTPWLPLRRFRGTSNVGMYGDFVRQVDDLVGEVLGALDRLGMAENTLVIFTSDNGPVWYAKDREKFGHAATGPFRGMKGDAWEGGHRMPFIARWPGHIPAGTSSDQTLCFTDMLATFAALTDQKLDKDQGRDSVNMLPAFLGEAGEEPLREATLHQGARATAIRVGSWKYIPARGSAGFIGRPGADGDPDGPPGQLYNLEKDPGEQHNLYEQKPELVERLNQRRKQMMPGEGE